MKPGLVRSSVHRLVLCVALKVFRSCLSPLRFVAVVAVVALVAVVAFVAHHFLHVSTQWDYLSGYDETMLVSEKTNQG